MSNKRVGAGATVRPSRPLAAWPVGSRVYSTARTRLLQRCKPCQPLISARFRASQDTTLAYPPPLIQAPTRWSSSRTGHAYNCPSSSRAITSDSTEEGFQALGRAMLLTEEPAVDARPPAHHADRTTVAGVRRHGHRFVARIKGRYLGIFATRQEAEDAVEDAA